MKKRLLAFTLMFAMIISQMSMVTFAAGYEDANYENYVNDISFDYGGESDYSIYSNDTAKKITVDTSALEGHEYTLDC